MDKRSFIAFAVLMALVLGYTIFLEKVVYPRHPEWATHPATQPANTGGGAGLAGSSIVAPPGSASSATQPSPSAAAGAVGLQIIPATQPVQPVVIGSDEEKDPDYALGVHLTPKGAGVESVVVNDYKSIDTTRVYSFQNPYGPDSPVLGTRNIVLDGQTLDLSAVNWSLESSSPDTASFGLDIAAPAGGVRLHLTKTYRLLPRGEKKNRDNTSAGYEVGVAYHLTNTSASPESVRIEFTGPTMPPRETERSDDRQVIAGYDKGNQALDVTRDAPYEFKPEAAQKDLAHSSKGYNILWTGMNSLYFGAIVQPETVGQLQTVTAAAQNPQDPADDRRLTLDFQTAEIKLDRGASADVPLDVFFGPKRRAMLEGDYYGNFPRQYNQLLVTSTGICGLCAFPWLVDRLVDLLGILKWVLHDWGLAIIALVVIVRVLLHPITKSSQVSMMKMQKMGPEMERLKKKHGDDKEAMTKAQMEMYKEMGFTPFLGCLPMFLQMPIWFALYSALQSEIELRQAPFLGGWTWIHDLARPDRLVSFDAHAFTIPLVGLKIAALNVLPLLLAVVFFLQQKYTPKPPATTPEQASQQKMMQWMTLLFPLFLYPAPSGLNLYILTSTTMGIIESKRIRDHIKQREEAEKSGRITVDTKPTRQGKASKNRDLAEKAAGKKRGIAGWWANMQQRAEEFAREAEKRKNKKK